MMSEKIRPHHLERKAILYVRQSSAHQVLHNRESYAPRQGNDRLLLGLKGSLNEYELDLLRQAFALGTLREGPTWRTRGGRTGRLREGG
jgi:hypothetical protein